MSENNKIPAVLGIGNALVDIMTVIEEETVLKEFGLPRGSMTLVDAELSKKIYNATINYKREKTTGGSVANSIHAIACLGGNAGYLGKIGDDELGVVFKEEFEKNSIKTHFCLSEKETGRVMAMVSPDSERTMATYLGAAAELVPEDITPNLFDGYSYLYIEGYLVQNHALIEKAIKQAKSEGLKVAIDLSSFNIVEENLEFLENLISGYVDIVFANEEEAKAFTGKEPAEALEIIAKKCDIAIVKIGKDGSMIKSTEQVELVKSIKANPVDTTGAGDGYAAGFLYGLTLGLPLKKCGQIASYLSGKVVEVMGAKLPSAKWPDVLKEVQKLK